MEDRDRYAARSDPRLGECWELNRTEEVYRGLYQDLRFWSRDQNARGDEELQSPKFLFARNVLKGLPLRASLDRAFKLGRLGGRELILRVRDEEGTGPLQYVGEQRRRFASGFKNLSARKRVGRPS